MCGRIVLCFAVGRFKEFFARLFWTVTRFWLTSTTIFLDCYSRLRCCICRLPFAANFKKTQRRLVFVLVIHWQFSNRFQLLSILHRLLIWISQVSPFRFALPRRLIEFQGYFLPDYIFLLNVRPRKLLFAVQRRVRLNCLDQRICIHPAIFYRFSFAINLISTRFASFYCCCEGM